MYLNVVLLHPALTSTPELQPTGLVIDVQMEAPAPKPKVFVLELSEQEWKENHQMGAFAGMKISYTMEGDKYKIEMTAEQYEKYKKNCGEFPVPAWHLPFQS